MTKTMFGIWAAALMIIIPAGQAQATTVDMTDETDCMSLAIYFEAKTEDETGMVAVAAVILNRVAHEEFPNTVCAVVRDGGETPPCQFSYWCDGKSDRPKADDPAWPLAREVAARVLGDGVDDPTGGGLFFHVRSLDSPWKKNRVKTTIIGNHVFYR